MSRARDLGAILTIVGSLIAALLPVLVKWLTNATKPKSDAEVLADQSDRQLTDLATAVQHGDAIDVAAVWAEHDRVLLHEGIAPADNGGGGRLGDPTLPTARDVLHRLQGLDASTDPHRSGAASEDPAATGSTEAAVIPTQDWTW